MSDEKSRRRSEDQEKSGRGSEDQEKGGNACLKIILTLVNLVVLACECALLGALIFFAAKEREILVEQVGQDTYDISFGGVIALSSIVILISLLGALGGIKENSFLLKLVSSPSGDPVRSAPETVSRFVSATDRKASTTMGLISKRSSPETDPGGS